MSADRLPHRRCPTWNGRRRARLTHLLDLFEEDSQLNVYRGELEVRPPCAPTMSQNCGPARQDRPGCTSLNVEVIVWLPRLEGNCAGNEIKAATLSEKTAVQS
jgi:hypothetical protein